MVGSQGRCGGTGRGSAHTEERLWRKEVLLVSRPAGLPSENNFEIRQSELVFTRPPSPGSVVLKVLWLSIDPYIRAMMNEDNGLSDLPSLELGQVRMLKEAYNFDEALNYKSEKDLSLALKRFFPDGFDVYFENVGGNALEAALDNIRRKGRIVACGMISEYNKDPKERKGAQNLMKVIGKSLKIEGFLVGDYTTPEYWNRCMKEIEELLRQGKIRYQEHILGRGIGEFPKAFVGLLKGENSGKAVLLVNDD